MWRSAKRPALLARPGCSAGENAADTAVVLVKDSFPVYNADVAESLGLSIPDAYAEAQKVTTTA